MCAFGWVWMDWNENHRKNARLTIDQQKKQTDRDGKKPNRQWAANLRLWSYNNIYTTKRASNKHQAHTTALKRKIGTSFVVFLRSFSGRSFFQPASQLLLLCLHTNVLIKYLTNYRNTWGKKPYHQVNMILRHTPKKKTFIGFTFFTFLVER